MSNGRKRKREGGGSPSLHDAHVTADIIKPERGLKMTTKLTKKTGGKNVRS